MQAMKKSARSSIAIDKSDDILLVIGRFLLPEGLYVLRLFLLAGAPCLPMPKADKRTYFAKACAWVLKGSGTGVAGLGYIPSPKECKRTAWLR